MLFATYKTGAEGLNLTEASHIILSRVGHPLFTNKQSHEAMNWSDKGCPLVVYHSGGYDEEKVLDICGTKYDIMGLFLGDNHTLSNGIKFDKSMIGQILGK